MGWESIWRRCAPGSGSDVEEPLPVVERHVGIRPLRQDVAGEDGQPREERALSASPADAGGG